MDNPKKAKYLKYIAGLDVSYSKTNSNNAVSAIVICEYPSLKVIYEDFEIDTTEYPYIPGFLAFREVPGYQKLFDRLKLNKPQFWP